MSDEIDFNELFTEADKAELGQAFAAVDAEDPEATLARNVADLTTNPALAWRAALSQGCVEEGVAYQWTPPEAKSFFFVLGAHPVVVPDGYLEALREQGSHPHAVACLMKAISIDPRFRGWTEDDEDPDDE